MTTTTYLELDDQATGANNNTWGDVADANMGFIELAIARYLGVATTGGTTTLTTAQNRYPLIVVTGVLVSNATIVVRTAEKHFVIINNTTGAYTVTVKTTAGTGKTMPRGRATRVYCDGTNVELARHQSTPHAAAGGTVDAITATFEPAWVAAEIQDGTMWIVEAAGANTSPTPNFTPDGGSTYTIKKFGAQALAVGDIRAAGHKLLLMYDTSGGHVELLNPATVTAATESVAGVIELSTTAEAQALSNDATAITPLKLKNAATGKKAIWIDASAMRPKITASAGAGFSDYDSGTNDLTLRCADFDTTTQEYAHFKMAMPEIWDEGTVTFKPYWTNTAGLTTETVVFSLAGAAFSNDDGINGTAFGTVQTSTDTWLAQNDLHIGPESAAITIAGTPAAGDLVVFEVSRVVASDNLTGDARLIGLMLYVTTNAFNEA